MASYSCFFSAIARNRVREGPQFRKSLPLCRVVPLLSNQQTTLSSECGRLLAFRTSESWFMGNWIVAAAIGFVSIICIRYLIVWLRYRGERVITCPENRRPAGVALGAGRAAVLGSFRLSACSRWPEHAGCGQECLAQIQESPEACLVRNILTDWYRGKSCALLQSDVFRNRVGGAKAGVDAGR